MYVLGIALSLLIGVALGLLGGGGSILTVPILLYVLDMDKKAAIAASLVVVGITSATVMISHARQGNVEWRTGLIFAAAGMAGAYVGGFVAGWIPATALLLMFATMMLATSIAMIRGRKEVVAEASARMPLPKLVGVGLIVGALTGTVGAGGGFLVVPALALLGGLPMRRAVGTSLLVIALNSAAGYAGHASHAHIAWGTTGMVTASAVIGSLVGSRLISHVSQETLRRAFGWFVLLMSFYMYYKQF